MIMASPNVDKMVHTLQESEELLLEFQKVLVKIEEAAGVDLTKDEKKEFLREIGDLASQEIFIGGVWI